VKGSLPHLLHVTNAPSSSTSFAVVDIAIKVIAHRALS